MSDDRAFPNGRQPLCFNETASRVNWHYVRCLFDTEALRSPEFQCNDLELDLRDVDVPTYEEPCRGISDLLNFYVAVRTHANVRNFPNLDLVVLSVDW